MGRTYVVDPRRARKFGEAVADWYDPERRSFPWRSSSDPYYVTICEVLLQRTNAEKVVSVVTKLFGRFVLPDDLARADLSAVEQVLRPLGLPARARWVKEIAATFARAAKDGRPIRPEELEKLPGVGPYVGSAVRVLVFGAEETVIDEHVLRILRRVFRVHAPPRRHPTKGLKRFANSLVPSGRAKEFNLGLLDLGRLICRAANPHCHACPVRTYCDYYAQGGETFAGEKPLE